LIDKAIQNNGQISEGDIRSIKPEAADVRQQTVEQTGLDDAAEIDQSSA
jgi:hypothetical protein